MTVSDGIEIACLKGGEGSQALVLVHGWARRSLTGMDLV